jgi:hypothetical protein
MLRSILLGIWICVVALTSLFAILWLTSGNSSTRTIDDKSEIFKLGSINVPVIENSQVTGYVIAQLDFVIDPAKSKLIPMPLEIFISGQTYAFLYDRRGQDALKRNASRLDKAMDDLRNSINTRYNVEAVRAIEVRQLDFLTKEEIRDMQMRKSAN